MVRKLADEEKRDWRQILPSYQMTVAVGPDRAAARREANDFLNRYYITSFKTLEESYWVKDAFGTPDDVIARVRAQQEAGCRLVCLRFAARDQFEQLDRFTRLVVPAFR
jgi:alkanesulfonate monooxygenase SsuD/methylene tetrahydromethanopterin reductase-like flavin-dependent oxidoreductase (luciferase family)